jgi:hypothetical protein
LNIDGDIPTPTLPIHHPMLKSDPYLRYLTLDFEEARSEAQLTSEFPRLRMRMPTM